MFLDNPVFHATMHDGAIGIVKFLIKRKMLVVAKAMLDNYYDESRLDDNLLAARIALKDGYFSQAEELFAKAYEIENHGEQSLKGYAQASFHCAHYAKATELYRRLSELFPDKQQYKMNEAIALINDNKEDEAVKILYELYYNDQGNVDVRRVLAWGLLCTKQTEKALKLYEGILASGSDVAVDHLNAGYCLWFMGQGEGAAKRFTEFVSIKAEEAKKQRRIST